MVITLVAFTWVYVSPSTTASEQSKNSTAAALLQGAEQVRTRHDNVRVELQIDQSFSGQHRRVDCLVEANGTKRRSEVLPSQGNENVVIVVDGNEVRGFRRKPHEDLQIYDMKRAVGARSDLSFDPRVLGLTDQIVADTKPRSYIWYENVNSLELDGKETVRGVTTFRVKAKVGGVVSTYWIEEPGFRIHRRTIESGGDRTVIESMFDPANPTFPFPTRVEAIGTGGPAERSLSITVKRFEFGNPVSLERFTTKAMNLPVGTAVVDSRTKRISGYWDGESISSNPIPTEAASQDKQAADSLRSYLHWLVGLGAILLLAVTVRAIRWRSFRRGAA